MKYSTSAENAAVEVTKVLEVTTSGAGRIGYRFSTARAAPVTVTVVDRIDALTTAQLPATDDGRWTLTDSTLECQLQVDPDQPATTVVRFRTDDPEIVAESRRPPQLDVVGQADSTSIADRAPGEMVTDANDETGGFDFSRTTDGDGRSDNGTQRPHDTAPPRDGGRTASDGGTDEFSMPDDEYTEAELISAGPNTGADE